MTLARTVLVAALAVAVVPAIATQRRPSRLGRSQACRRRRAYGLQASLDTLRRPFAARSLTVAGRPLRSWRYDPATWVLPASFRLRSGTLAVR